MYYYIRTRSLPPGRNSKSVSIERSLLTGGMGKAEFIEWIKADFREWSKADSTYAASQQTLFIVSGSPSNPILGEVI